MRAKNGNSQPLQDILWYVYGGTVHLLLTFLDAVVSITSRSIAGRNWSRLASDSPAGNSPGQCGRRNHRGWCPGGRLQTNEHEERVAILRPSSGWWWRCRSPQLITIHTERSILSGPPWLWQWTIPAISSQFEMSVINQQVKHLNIVTVPSVIFRLCLF